YAEDMQGLPPSLLEIIKRSIAPDPAQRYATADELARAFEHACRTLSSPQLPAVPQQYTSENITATTSPPSHPPLRARPQSQEQVVISPLERLQQRRASGEYPPIDASDAGSLPGVNSDPGKRSGTE